MDNQTRNHLSLQKHIADQDHIIRVRNAEIAALRKRAEKAEKERDHLATVLATTTRQRDEADKRNAHPLTPDAITDEMVERGARVLAYWDGAGGWGTPQWGGEIPESAYIYGARKALTAALTEPPKRPEGAEKVEAVLHRYWSGDINGDDLADRIVEEMSR